MKGLIGPSEMPHPSGDGAAHILVVEDDEDMRELLRLHLEGAGYRVIAAEDAVVAGHCMMERTPDLIIVDHRMPYMTGIEFVGALRGDATIPDIPVIFLTAIENAPELVGRTYGFPLLTKPLLADELLAAVAAQLDSRKRAHSSAGNGAEHR
ncbi:MAG TPA: response regulator [Burkholderiales bacterium]|nr:response regulator [Burkholderiales bacterium]